jgi:hypothetical protein
MFHKFPHFTNVHQRSELQENEKFTHIKRLRIGFLDGPITDNLAPSMPMKLQHKSSVGMIACQNSDPPLHGLQIPVDPVLSIGRRTNYKNSWKRRPNPFKIINLLEICCGIYLNYVQTCLFTANIFVPFANFTSMSVFNANILKIIM